MAAKKSARTPAKISSKRATTGKAAQGLSADERVAARERVRELRSAARPSAESGESVVLAKIAAMAAPDRAIAERLHAMIGFVAPDLVPRTWYGMPAYAKQGSIVCFFQDARKFKTRYCTLGFTDKAALDDGEMWPVAFALTELTRDVEARITELLKRAIR